ncbi:putative beta-calactosidase [Xylariomycetidae sp. FL0641]|nr:putative beta-calactosidase [Xylariomycetidae sp. FL0641]
MHSIALFTAAAAFVNVAVARPAPRNESAPFRYDNTTFYLHGEPYQIIGGQMDPQRVPRPYWSDRLTRARSMGLNTIFSYVYWNELEKRPGEWDFEDRNDIATWFQLAQDANLTVVLRPGPFIGAEHEWGGFPSWLQEIPDMEIRRYNEPFLEAVYKYFDRVGEELRPLQVTEQGPLIMVQVENEYGSYGDDHEYMQALTDSLRKNFNVPLYTTDSGEPTNLENAAVPGVLAEIDGQAKSGFEARASVKDPSRLGPLLNGEYYTTWFDYWGSNASHISTGGTYFQGLYVKDDVQYILEGNNSISFYMFHGGTNWDYGSSSLWDGNGYIDAATTSYDYGAPLDESGRTTPFYETLRGYITEYSQYSEAPDIPENVPLMAVPEFSLHAAGGLFDDLGDATAVADFPMHMEALNQSRGFVLYEHTADTAMNGTLIVGDKPRDRVIAYVNGARVGVQSSTYAYWDPIRVDLQPGDRVQLLVENLGRISFQHPMDEQRKGIMGNVTIDNSTVLSGWSMYSLPLLEVPAATAPASSSEVAEAPALYSGTFNTTVTTGDDDAARDTFLEIKGGLKGVVWVNGHNMGRYWAIGPQQSLYVPGCYLHREGGNEVVVLELEPRAGLTTLAAQGRATRIWGNNVDPDAPFTQ